MPMRIWGETLARETLAQYIFTRSGIAEELMEHTEHMPKKKKKKPKLQTGEQIMTRLLGSLERGNRAKEIIKSVGVKKVEKNNEGSLTLDDIKRTYALWGR
jgi:protoporphyrinogen oxidase